MTGKELKEIVKNSKVKAKELIEKSGIPEQTYFSLYKKTEIEQHFIDALKKAGLKINTTENYIEPQETTSNTIQTTIDYLHKTIEILEQNNKLLMRIVNSELDNGAVFTRQNKQKTT